MKAAILWVITPNGFQHHILVVVHPTHFCGLPSASFPQNVPHCFPTWFSKKTQWYFPILKIPKFSIRKNSLGAFIIFQLFPNADCHSWRRMRVWPKGPSFCRRVRGDKGGPARSFGIFSWRVEEFPPNGATWPWWFFAVFVGDGWGWHILRSKMI